ncbi:MAG: tetratricopeptide repeat protein [Xanthomonadales bacterium]|jgi:predicted O-linked N-acetylglucosamine transferase (SPINDLY family)|nr:tetratricopeptide repeat protein [Xanthomonadales bacterium]
MSLAAAWGLLQQGQLAPAAQAFRALIATGSRDPQAWRGLALAEFHRGELDAAVAALTQACQLAPEQADLHGQLGALLHVKGDLGAAASALHTALRLNPGDFGTMMKLGAVLGAQGQLDEAAFMVRRVVARAPDNADAWHILGDLARAQGDLPAAQRAYQRAVALKPEAAGVWFNLGICARENRDWTEAERAFTAALKADPKCYPAMGQLAFLRRQLALWEGTEALVATTLRALAHGLPSASPFEVLSLSDDPALQRQAAELASRRVLNAPGVATLPARAPLLHSGPVRVGFISNGFGEHPTGLLTAEFFTRLDPKRLKLHLYATAPDDGGPIRKRLAAAAAVFRELSPAQPQRAAEQIARDGVELLIDLRGWGGGAVPEILARRPAPIQAFWLAFPGGSGAPWIDYLIADEVVIPAAERRHYREAVVQLPRCFQPSDGSRPLRAPATRAALALPESAVVLACFNNGYKFNPTVWAVWMQLLRLAPQAVLWLLATGDTDRQVERLQAAAAAAGINPARIVFAAKRPHLDYLADLQQADLFLDTWPYGAHTTAADALYAGVPLLTLAQRSFASRVGASLLSTLGLPELIASDADEYLQKAVLLVHDAGERHRLRERLQQQRPHLFDTVGLAQVFTRAVEIIHARACRGDSPSDLQPLEL